MSTKKPPRRSSAGRRRASQGARGRPPAADTWEIAALALALAKDCHCTEEVAVRAIAPIYVSEARHEQFVGSITRAMRKLKRGPTKKDRLDTLMTPFAGLGSGIDHRFFEHCKSLLPRSILKKSR